MIFSPKNECRTSSSGQEREPLLQRCAFRLFSAANQKPFLKLLFSTLPNNDVLQGVKSQFISLTAPNHMSIVTGLHPQKHGIVSNEFYDPDLKKLLVFLSKGNLFSYDVFNLTQTPGVVATARESEWYFGEPIWLTNEKAAASRRSASIRWPAGEATLSQAPHQPHYSM